MEPKSQAERESLPDTSFLEEPLLPGGLSIVINTGEYIKQERTDNTGEGMMPGQGMGEEMVEAGYNNALWTEAGHSNGVSGEVFEAQVIPKPQEMLNNVERPATRSQTTVFPGTQFSLMLRNGRLGTSTVRRGRGVAWRYKETLDLLDIWGQENIQDELRSSHRNLDFFEYIANEMTARGHQRNAVECRGKTKALRLEYKRVIEHNAKPGNTKVTCPFYKLLHQILRGNATRISHRVSQSRNLNQTPEQEVLPDTSILEEPLLPINIIDIGEYIKQERTDSTGEDMMPSQGTEEGPVEASDNYIIWTAEEGSNGVSGREAEAERPQVRHEPPELLNNVERPATRSQKSAFPGTRLSLVFRNGRLGTSTVRRGRGVAWRYKETLDLLDIWGQENIQDELRSSHRNLDFFEYIASEMTARGHRRTATECRGKTKAMRLEYKRVIEHNSKPGNIKVTCPFYKQLHWILRGNAVRISQRVSHRRNVNQAPQQEALPDTSILEEHSLPEDVNVIDTGKYIKEESTDSTGEGMMPGYGTEEEMVQTGDSNAIWTEEEGSNGISGELESERLQLSPETEEPLNNVGGEVETERPRVSLDAQEPLNNVEQPTVRTQTPELLSTRLPMLRNPKKRERCESMFDLFLEQAREDSVKEQQEMVRDRVMLAKFLRAFEQDAADSREERRQCLEALRANCEVLRGIVGGLNKLTDALTSRR